jgi:hypothetical protein
MAAAAVADGESTEPGVSDAPFDALDRNAD